MHWQKDYSLKSLNTFGLNEKASYFNSFASLEELEQALDTKPNADLFVLGGGSNMLLTGSLDRAVLLNRMRGISHQINGDRVIVTAAGGEIWHELVMHCVEQNWGGIENLSLIPGSVGAAPIQNIGAYGVELKDCFHSLKAYNLESKEIEQFHLADCEFAYRDSVFKSKLKGKYIILELSLSLSREKHNLSTHYGAIQAELAKLAYEEYSIKDVSNAVFTIRQSKLPDPKEIGNSGSFFKNPVISKEQAEDLLASYEDMPQYPSGDQVKIAAGWLIEKAGWKGFRRGDAGVHKKQALVLVNYGNAAGADIWKLACEIIADVQLKFGIELEPEVNIL